MKRFLLSLGIIGIAGGMFSLTFANSSCKDVNFANSVSACVNIEDGGTDARDLTTTVSNGSTAALKCYIMTPSLDNSDYKSRITAIPTCNGEFLYDVEKPGRIKLRIRYNDVAPTTWEGKPSSNSQRTDPQWIYDFDNRERTDDDLQDDTSNGDLDNFSATTDDTTPTTSQYVDLTVKARDDNNDTITDYTDTVNFKVYYRASGSSTWTQTTSSSYYTMNSSYVDGYDFSSSDDGTKTFTNLIKFKKNNYDYKVRVYDENDASIYKEVTFTVGSTSSSNDEGDLNNFSVTTDDMTPTTSQYVDLTVKARDSSYTTLTDYTDTVNFNVYYRASGNSTWTQTTSSSYYTMNSSYVDGYDFTSSDDGTKTFTNFIKFRKNNYDYKVRVYDENNASIYKEITFTVGSTSSSSSVDGFTSTELTTVKSIYTARNSMITNLKNTYSKLRNSTSRKDMSDDLKEAMKEIIDDSSSKTYTSFTAFNTAFVSRYDYTVETR